MTTVSILVSPTGYDNVNLVLQQLGGIFANTRQLDESEAHLMQDLDFLMQFQHLFLNCHAMFQDGLDYRLTEAIRDFVNSGRSLYASDWASNIVEAAFSGRTSFRRDMRETGIVTTRVKDPYLAKSIGRKISIHFDLTNWHLIERFPSSADIYLLDEQNRALAIGFRAELGRVVFTSFHHHAQREGVQVISDEEKKLLRWIVTLPTQHSNILYTQNILAKYRAPNISNQVVSWVGSDSNFIPVKLGAKSGLGIFVLSWDYDKSLEFSIRYRHRGEVVRAEKKSKDSPLVMTVRNPKDEDSIEIHRESLDRKEDAFPYVFEAGVRRDLLGDPDWLSLAIARNIRKILDKSDVEQNVKDSITVDAVLKIASTILTALGFEVTHRFNKEQKEDWSEIVARSLGKEEDSPDLQMEARVIDCTSLKEEPYDYSGMFAELLSPRDGVTEATERIFACLIFSRKGTEGLQGDEDIIDKVWPASEIHGWRAVASDRMTLELSQDIVSVEELAELIQLYIIIYQLQECY